MIARIVCLLSLIVSVAKADPQLSSWLTQWTGNYARVYLTDADVSSNTTYTTWSRNTMTQSLPTYAGASEVSYSADYVYIRTTGLAPYVMGPWYNGTGHVTLFPNVPTNLATIYRIPRTPVQPTNKVATLAGFNGLFVDGVAMFDMRDVFSVADPTGTESSTTGLKIWNRDATVIEGVTFDPAFAHSQGAGMYHYHSNPRGVRYLLGDNMLYNATTKAYSENTANTNLKHSPIIGWVRDGYPMYGPYGYSSAMNPNSAIRRMVSGYVLRNGQNGTENLSSTGRVRIPNWAVRSQGGLYATLDSTQYGPAVSGTRALGRYIEDNDYLGDLVNPSTGSSYVQGADFDLDEFNGRFCVTPEFPGGTYAYFVSINADGTPKFPYYLGRMYYSRPLGGVVTSITEAVTVLFSGGPKKTLATDAPSINSANGNVSLTWSAIDGGTYTVETSSNLSTWSTLGTSAPATQTLAPTPSATRTITDPGAAFGGALKFYRVQRTAIATFDSSGFGP
ncbi:MAG: YHYH protein [Verrucomicrobiaceae bacterium]|nr:YHYH protein [Verrucomicrobiaceae bacterium]